MARSIPADQHEITENLDAPENAVRLEATDARSGSRDRDVFVVLMISVVLAVLALAGAFIYYSGALTGSGNQTRSQTSFEQSASPSTSTAGGK